MSDTILDHELDGPIAWTRDTLSAADGAIALTEDCLAEIRAFDEVFHVDVVPLPNLA